jgi:5'-3' exoribonuclease 2
MGVPAFYRWLLTKYPNTVVNAIEEKHDSVDLRSQNPNRVEFDNLYLDMNGIIHPCFHPENQMFMPSTFDEVFENVFEYIDRIFRIVRPRKILFLAIDGVAPRAKMNQQRTRRFQTSKHNELAENEENRLRIQFENEGKEILPKAETETSDSNIITPGTEFMYKLSKELQKYICVRMNNEPGWKEIKVILSDANVPGEGEHKIMSFIRLQRALPNYNPNTRHCLYGLDADLIMLALATHEIHFSVLRENVFAEEQKQRSESSPAITNLETDKENGSSKSRGWFTQCPEKQEQNSDLVDTVKRKSTIVQKPYQFLHVWILREYLELDMKAAIPSEKFNVEKVIDDFIFICFFVGNDFLPHMPTLDIREGAIDLLMHVYKTEFNNLGDYLVDMEKIECKHAGYIKLSRVEKFILKVGAYEEKIFNKRSALQERNLRQIQAEFERNRNDEEDELLSEFDKNSDGISRAVNVSDEDQTSQSHFFILISRFLKTRRI